MPQITPSIRRQPFNAIGLARIIPVLRLVVHGIYRHEELRRVTPPSEGAILDDVIQLESLHPLLLFGSTQGAVNDSHITKGLTGAGRIHPIGIHKERGVNGHRRAPVISGESHLDRVQVNVAALKGKEEEEAN